MALAMSTFLLVHFGMIWAYGRFYIYESNPLILILETTMMVAILSFSFYCLVEQVRMNKEFRASVQIHDIYYSRRNQIHQDSPWK